MREADTKDLGLRIGGRKISNLRYADDTALLADNLSSMKRVLNRVGIAGRKTGLNQSQCQKDKSYAYYWRKDSGK